MDERDPTHADDLIRRLHAGRDGDPTAWDRFVALVYHDLRRLAHRRLAGQPRDQTLDTTGLVNECYLRIARGGRTPNDRRHFLALAARVMRQVIVDHARERLAVKRGGREGRVSLEVIDESELAQAQDFVALDDALGELARHSERRARVVECRFFAGLSEDETAEAVGISLRLVQREWKEARRWLAEFLRA